MADVHTKEQRSYNMSQIRSKWTSQERKFHNYLKGKKIRHKMHPDIEGSPDIVLKGTKTAVFLHGCFWHKCPECYVEPKSNRDYWLPKIEKNVKRDRKNKKVLKRDGWNVVEIWEHEVKKDATLSVKKIIGM